MVNFGVNIENFKVCAGNTGCGNLLWFLAMQRNVFARQTNKFKYKSPYLNKVWQMFKLGCPPNSPPPPCLAAIKAAMQSSLQSVQPQNSSPPTHPPSPCVHTRPTTKGASFHMRIFIYFHHFSKGG